MLYSFGSAGIRSPDLPDRRRAPYQLTSRHRQQQLSYCSELRVRHTVAVYGYHVVLIVVW
eukprot:scaffold454912_cov18-Prasinocladus_malaysianus.AAC.1